MSSDSIDAESGVGKWVAYRNNNTSAFAASLVLTSAYDTGADPGTNLTATAVTAGNAGNNIRFSFYDSGVTAPSVGTTTYADGTREIQIGLDFSFFDSGFPTNSAVVSAIQGNGTANSWVSVSTANGGGTFAPSTQSHVFDTSQGGKNYWLKGGYDANQPSTSVGTTGAGTLTQTTPGALSNTQQGKAYLNLSHPNITNSGMSVPFTIPDAYRFNPVPLRISFKYSASPNSYTYQVHLIDVDNGFSMRQSTADFTDTNGASRTVSFIIDPRFAPTGGVPVRQYSNSYRLAIHGAASQFLMALAIDEVVVEPYVGQLQSQDDVPQRNHVMNSGFDVWQRGTSITNTATNTFTADRWKRTFDGTGGTLTISRQAFSPADLPVSAGEPRFYLRWNHNGGAGTGQTFERLTQPVESVRTLANRAVTLSYYSRITAVGAQWSVRLNQHFGTGGSPSATVSTAGQFQGANSGGPWVKYTHTFMLPSIAGKTVGTNNDDRLEVVFDFGANVNYSMDIAQVMLTEGSVQGASFSRMGRDVGEELRFCQRFYEKSYDTDISPGTATSVGGHFFVAANATNQEQDNYLYKVTKRATPIVQVYSPSTGTANRFRNFTTVTDVTPTTAPATQIGVNGHTLGWGTLADTNLYGAQWTIDAEIY
jgi:hypothetical protein